MSQVVARNTITNFPLLKHDNETLIARSCGWLSLQELLIAMQVSKAFRTQSLQARAVVSIEFHLSVDKVVCLVNTWVRLEQLHLSAHFLVPRARAIYVEQLETSLYKHKEGKHIPKVYYHDKNSATRLLLSGSKKDCH